MAFYKRVGTMFDGVKFTILAPIKYFGKPNSDLETQNPNECQNDYSLSNLIKNDLT